MKSFLSFLLIVTIGVSPVLTRGQSTAQDQDEVIRFRSNEVRLDVVVKDKKGRPIRDLKAADFEVLEDGVAQKVESFRFVTRETNSAKTETKDDKVTAAPATTTAPRPRSAPTVTALVFDRLSPQARYLARKSWPCLCAGRMCRRRVHRRLWNRSEPAHDSELHRRLAVNKRRSRKSDGHRDLNICFRRRKNCARTRIGVLL